MATTTQTRARRARIDKAVSAGFVQPIRRAFRAEQRAVAKAGTIAAAEAAVSDGLWIATMTKLWLSAPILALWTDQQHALGTDYKITAAVRKRLTLIAVEHGRAIADTNRASVRRALEDAPEKAFRSTQRRALSELYAHQVTDRATHLAFVEALQATETIRYEASRNASETAKFRTRKVWFTQGDSKVRPTHQAVNGQSRFVHHEGWGGKPGRFRVGGASLAHPREPGGPPQEVIGCRCFLEYRRVRRKP